ncbi:GNAT family N-acetyltransferase, partial [Nonomuraea sp. NPDC049784]|uniref:GNAT family N-acetyltransferase n=1 Tax=Nonomuraea sp. NPDC049784 TaxID=3154361 RepID=UPI0033E76A00
MAEVRELHEIAEFERVSALFDVIWHFGPASPPVTIELMRAISHAGGYVAGAFDGDRLVGGSVGFLAAGSALHSHVTGTAAGRGIGLELKLHQRRWALERGLERITWTYDPLVRHNAHFNLAKLGARPTEYLPCFYGVMEDAINHGDESDRLLAVWSLSDPHVEALARREPYPMPVPDGAVVALADEDGRP